LPPADDVAGSPDEPPGGAAAGCGCSEGRAGAGVETGVDGLPTGTGVGGTEGRFGVCGVGGIGTGGGGGIGGVGGGVGGFGGGVGGVGGGEGGAVRTGRLTLGTETVTPPGSPTCATAWAASMPPAALAANSASRPDFRIRA